MGASPSKKGRKIGRWKRKGKVNNKDRNLRIKMDAELRKLKKRHPSEEYKIKDGRIVRKRKVYTEKALASAKHRDKWYSMPNGSVKQKEDKGGVSESV